MVDQTIWNNNPPESDNVGLTIATISAIERSVSYDDDDRNPLPRTELDTHANMIVLGTHAYIYDGTSNSTCDVMPYDPNLGTAEKVPIVDGAVAYDCPRTMETYIRRVK